MKYETYFEAIAQELEFATNKFPPLNSTHEGYAVICEELDELWDLIKMSKLSRSNADMESECIQIAAMAIRFMDDLKAHI